MKRAIAALLVVSAGASAADQIVYTGGSQRYEGFIDTTPGDGGPPDESFLIVEGLDPSPCCPVGVTVDRQVKGGTLSAFAGGGYLGIARDQSHMRSESLNHVIFDVPPGSTAHVFTRFTNTINFTLGQDGPVEFVGFASKNQYGGNLGGAPSGFSRAEFRVTPEGQTEPIFQLVAEGLAEVEGLGVQDHFQGTFDAPAGNYTLFLQVEGDFLGTDPNGSAGNGEARVSFFMEKIFVPPACPGDADGSGSVDFGDITSVLANWGATGSAVLPGDADGFGPVDFADITSVLANWGSEC